MSKINLSDSTMDIVLKMSEGNPGAMNAIMQMLDSKSNEIDPDAFMGGVLKVLALDTLGIYGSDIYVLHNDICDRDMIKMFAVLRAHQLGFLNGSVLADACHKQDYSGKQMIDVEKLYKQVIDELPNFKRLEVNSI
ncbi:MAG: hypothetical protein WAW57_15320 [Lutibacter sp.]